MRYQRTSILRSMCQIKVDMCRESQTPTVLSLRPSPWRCPELAGLSLNDTEHTARGVFKALTENKTYAFQ